MPVAITTRSVRMAPPAVKTSAVLRVNVIFLTGDCSNRTAPRAAAAAASPRQAR